MTRRISVIAIVVMTLFMGSITTILFVVGSNYPERTVPVPLVANYDTSFWNLTNVSLQPLNVNNHSSSTSVIEYQNTTVSVNEWYFDYTSEVFKGEAVRINSVIITQQNLTAPMPTILYLHGYGEQYADYLQMLRVIAASGLVVMGIDQPGSGNSTGFPDLSPFTFLNVTNGPQDSSLFHSVWAATRALSLLESLPQVRTDSLVVAGNSMGGLVTFILSGIDSRVDGSVPMLAGGNFLNSLTSGSLLNIAIDPTYYIGSEELSNIIKWFDPLAYAKLLTKPVLMIFGTDDQFFPITSMMDTINAIETELTLNIVPNWGHEVNFQWSHDIIRWINSHFRDDSPLPKCQVSFTNDLTLEGSCINIEVEAENTNKAILYWRSSEPGAIWLYAELNSNNENSSTFYTGKIVPLAIGKVLFYVITIQGDSTQLSSRIFVGSAGASFFPVLLVLSSIGILFLLHYNIWQPRKIHLLREIPYVIGIVTLASGFVLPFITIRGRASLSLFNFIELYGESFLLGGWFLPTALTAICFVISLSAFRHRFQFRAAVFLWIPILLLTIILYVIFNGVFTLLGDIFAIEAGIGAVALTGAVPLMQILDRLVKSRIKWV